MNCHKIQNLASAFVDSELSGLEMLAIRHHIHECDECRMEIESLLAIKKSLGVLNAKHPDDALAARILQQIDQSAVPAQKSVLQDLGKHLTVFPKKMRWAAAGASVFALLFMLRAGGMSPVDYPPFPASPQVQVGSFAEAQPVSFFPTVSATSENYFASQPLHEPSEESERLWDTTQDSQILNRSTGLTFASF